LDKLFWFSKKSIDELLLDTPTYTNIEMEQPKEKKRKKKNKK
jgi:hypothetical protein